ncbi:hypothetical protein OVA11_18135 [Caulobacter sp. SL161]|uniref:hypothetical protein n=1 Tax=Caulobacter sp. SL161 TaxID=2995156 RepID=UPI002274D2A3|nr:hypothetical protein [Caulobacter sp. SL161]MCY1648901.1 hypothetical protein [Caulobacter sp. SL161]
MAITRRWATAAMASALISVGGCGVAFAADDLVIAPPGGSAPMRWASSKFGDRVEPRAAVLLPIRFEGLDKTFYAQFDLGAKSTVFYGKTLAAIADRAPGLKPGPKGELGAVSFTIGDVRASIEKPKVRADIGDANIEWTNPEAVDLIGTIGVDLLEDRVLTVDFKAMRLSIGVAAMPATSQWSPMTLKSRWVLLDATLEGKPTKLLLDTGSSAFSLLIDKARWSEMTTGQDAESFPVNSWGKKLMAHTAPTQARVVIGGLDTPLGDATYIEGTSVTQGLMMRATGMGGMTGNRLFFDRILILDAPGGRYAVLEPK